MLIHTSLILPLPRHHLSLKERKVISGTSYQGSPALGRAGGKVAGPLQMPSRGGVPGSSAERGSCPGSTLAMSTALIAALRQVQILAVTVC